MPFEYALPEHFALLHLLGQVEARFAADELAVANVFGWRAPTGKLATGDRILWTPGDPSKALGQIGPARQSQTGNPRSLATLHELCTCLILGADLAGKEDERLQYARARAIYDAWLRAVYLAARGTFTVISSKWVRVPTERVHGLGIQVVFAIDAKIPDAAKQLAPVDVGADLDVEQLDHTDNLTLPEEP